MKCVDCPNSTEFGMRYCSECLSKARERSDARYETMKHDRQCKFCLRPIGNLKGIYCQECGEKRKKKISQRKAEGICVTCGKEKAAKTTQCDRCHQAYVKNCQLRRTCWEASGLCPKCGKEDSIEGRTCSTCVLKNAARVHLGTTKRWKELRDLFVQQGGVCPYTGKKIAIGIDASVDHVVPKSRGGSLGIENLQWVYAPVNFMKQNLLEDEFLPLVSLIHEHRHPLIGI